MLRSLGRCNTMSTTALSARALPSGFFWATCETGVKNKAKASSPLDLAILYSPSPCVASATFTKNVFKAAPVVVSKAALHASFGQHIHGLIVNSGCANAVTGKQGEKDARTMVEAVNTMITKQPNSTLVMSTGVIGVFLQMDKILKGVEELVGRVAERQKTRTLEEGWKEAAHGFMTTDTYAKCLSREITLRRTGETFRIAGICKGAGMIHPNMATMLGTICTDLDIAPSCLNEMTSYAIERSFNCISVDGDMSTNDTCVVLANAEARTVQKTQSKRIETIGDADYIEVRDAITDFARELAQLIVRDGEGATKFLTIRVQGAPTYEEAKKVANSVCISSLVKTAFYGEDPNWGRILAAIGSTDVKSIVPKQCYLTIKGAQKAMPLVAAGEPCAYDEAEAAQLVKEKDLEVLIQLNEHPERGEEAVMWTCDLSHKYVDINASYRS